MKHDCPDEIQISAYADGELGSMDSARIKSHLSHCKNCEEVLASYRDMDTLIQDLSEIEVTDSFDRAFWNHLEITDRRPGWVMHMKSLFLGWRPVWAAAAVVCLVVGIYIYGGHDRESLHQEDMVMVENMDFFQNLEILQKLELLENWDALPVVNDRS